jgi:hypothetical protein
MSDPNGKIVDNGKVVILKEYPTCWNDGSCDCSLLTHDRALYDVPIKYLGSDTNKWVYLCVDCWDRYNRVGVKNYTTAHGSLGLGKAQRIVVTVGSLPLIRTLKDQRRCDGE